MMTYATPFPADRANRTGSLDEPAAAFALCPAVEAEGIVERLWKE